MPYVNPGRLVVMSPTRSYWEGTSDHDLIIYDGSTQAGDGNDTVIATTDSGPEQIHLYGQRGNDLLVLDIVGPVLRSTPGHHVWGELRAESDRSANRYSFTGTANVGPGGLVVGRIQDFDASRDTILIDGQAIDLNNLPSNVRVVAFNGVHNDPGATPQQWLLINTVSGGQIFYALDGYRVDMDGNGESGEAEQEGHFVPGSAMPDLSTLPTVAYVDPINYVPLGFAPNNGGLIINDQDDNIADVLEVLLGTAGGDLMAAGLNNDVVNARDGNDRVWGGDGDDTLNGENGLDTLEGGNGNDSLDGGAQQDELYGLRGSDYLFGGFGNDTLLGGADHDTLSGDMGDDVLIGGVGEDVLEGGDGNDTLDGEGWSDMLSGGEGDDYLDGGMNNDTLRGDGGNDMLEGRGGNDRMNGGGQSDTLMGGSGGDTISGDFGFDVLNGGAGSDNLIGGEGNDTFVFADGHGIDRIEDFDATINGEKIDVSGISGFDDFSDVAAAARQSGTRVVIETGGGSSIILENVSLQDLDPIDFIF